jgi:endoglycosylceramidase
MRTNAIFAMRFQPLPYIILFVINVVAALGSRPAPPAWRDSGNRTLLFHGVNVVHKGFPYIPITDRFDSNFSFAAEDVDFLRSIGCNAIRLGIIWAGAQPLPPSMEGSDVSFNATYLDEIERLVAIAAAGGIRVLLDVHQDLYSGAFCGEGAPIWAVDLSNSTLPFPEPIGPAFGPGDYDDEGLPTKEACDRHPWQDYQLAHSSAVAYQRLYTHPPLRAAYAEFLREIARRFKGNEAVIGLEIINEPFAGDVYKDPALLLPGVADRVNLAPFYQEVAAAIRLADPSATIFFESVTWDDVVCGFEQVPGGNYFANYSVLSYHYYRPPNLSPHEAMQHQMHECVRLGCRCFMTEFSLPLHGMPTQVMMFVCLC